MPDTTRTFIAVAVPASLELRLRRLQEQLAGEAPEMRWEVSLPFHVTLAFLGDVDHAELHTVCLAVAEAAAAFERFELKLEGLGAFPGGDRARTVWTGVGGTGLETLNALQVAVGRAAARFQSRHDPRPFHAHVTLGRSQPGRHPARDLSTIISHYRTWHAGPFSVIEAITFGSTTTREGPVYSPLGRAPLRGRKPGGSP